MAHDVTGAGWLLATAAKRLRAEGFEAAADGVLAVELTLEYGDSWWDGHDDYIYDVELTLIAPPDVEPKLAAAYDALATVLGSLVSAFPDESGDLRKGTLERLTVVSAPSQGLP